MIAGTVSDAATGETLPGAHVYKVGPDGRPYGVTTDANGRFSWPDLPNLAGDVVTVSFVGYPPKRLTLDGSAWYDVRLTTEGVGLPEFEVIHETEKPGLPAWVWIGAAVALVISQNNR